MRRFRPKIESQWKARLMEPHLRPDGDDEALACAMNVLAKAGTVGLFTIGALVVLRPDRCIAQLSLEPPGFIPRDFERIRLPLSEPHRWLETIVRPAEAWSFRENARPSLNVTLVADASDPQRFYGDLDIDLGNPRRDLPGLVVHVIEILWPGPTDAVAMGDRLRAAGLELEYDWVEGW